MRMRRLSLSVEGGSRKRVLFLKMIHRERDRERIIIKENKKKKKKKKKKH